MSDTPRTDANEKDNGLRCRCADNAYDLCRRLERENAALMEALTMYRGQIANDGKSGYAEKAIAENGGGK